MTEKILNELSIIASELTQTPQSIDLDSDFVKDCNLSSFQMAMFFCEVEDRFGILIEDFVKCRKADVTVNMIIKKGANQDE